MIIILHLAYMNISVFANGLYCFIRLSRDKILGALIGFIANFAVL